MIAVFVNGSKPNVKLNRHLALYLEFGGKNYFLKVHCRKKIGKV